jgi:hypothetical protein
VSKDLNGKGFCILVPRAVASARTPAPCEFLAKAKLATTTA